MKTNKITGAKSFSLKNPEWYVRIPTSKKNINLKEERNHEKDEMKKGKYCQSR